MKCPSSSRRDELWSIGEEIEEFPKPNSVTQTQEGLEKGSRDPSGIKGRMHAQGSPLVNLGEGNTEKR